MSDTRSLWAVVPVKSFVCAKQRLASLLSLDERAALAQAMLEDVLDALARSPGLLGTLVVTSDPHAASIARHAGAIAVAEAPDAGLVPAVRHAAGLLAAARCAGMLVVPADVPSITPVDVETIVRAHHGSAGVTLVAAGADGGTNALASSPPAALPIYFGPDSFQRHHAAALALGIEPQVLTLPRLDRDIDRPQDLMAFIEEASTTRTQAYLAASGIARRLGRRGAQAQAPHVAHACMPS